ncbi:MAG: hypothetical protein JRI68_00835 [Deltaproteobacteria bacterium]|nr:hypothetical protein [Deltaproteobacteria bacterium]
MRNWGKTWSSRAVWLGALCGTTLVVAACADALRLEPGVGGSTSTSSTSTSGGGGGAGPVACSSNVDCPEPTSVCDTVNAVCVECLVIGDCAFRPGTVCDEGSCDCPDDEEWCGPNLCVDAQTSSEHCGTCHHQCFGACIDGACADPWEPVGTTDAPQARARHAAVWTGDAMIVWGGAAAAGNATNLSTGGIYDPATFEWTEVSKVNAPSPRQDAVAVWTGDAMVVWGGRDGATYLNDGGVYDPATNTWTTMSATSAPSGRVHHTGVWTGSELVVWGGVDDTDQLNTGGIYNPSNDTWAATEAMPAPAAPRQYHTAVWNGSLMLVYGGYGDGTTATNIYLPADGVQGGNSFDPGASSGAWTALSQVGEPSARGMHSAVWDGTRLMVFGGWNATNYLANGFKLEGNTWAAFNGDGPSMRREHVAVYVEDASRMIVWGGRDDVGLLATGAVYDPGNNSWEADTPTALEARVDMSAISTGTAMIVWGGFNAGDTPLATGALYTP